MVASALAAIGAVSPVRGLPSAKASESDAAPIEIRYTATFPADTLTLGRSRGFDTVHLAGCDSVDTPGRPALPARTIRIALPVGMRATDVRVDRLQSRRLPGEYFVFPSQRPRPITPAAAKVAFVAPEPEAYASPEPFPEEHAVLLHQADLAGQGIAVVRVYPIQYVPSRRELTLHTSITLVVEGIGGFVCGDYLPVVLSSKARRDFERSVQRMVVNPGMVVLTTSPDAVRGSRGVEPGVYEYVIITQADWVEDFQPLADWRIQKGIPTRIVTTDWIYDNGGYMGSDLEKVRAFVADAHATWGATSFLLGGDTNVIPYHVRTVTVPDYSTDNIPNDTYYADYDEDWICEVHIGRASVRTEGAIGTFIDKVLTYEKNPPLADYATTAVFFGFDIADPGDGYGEASKELIRNAHLPGDWTFETEYDSDLGRHRADVLARLNQGYHLVNHHDHCNFDSMGTGWISHGDLIVTSDIEALTNGDRQSLLFAVGCNPCDIPVHTSIGEAFLKNPLGGGVAFMGNSRTGWGGSIEDPDYYSVRQDRLLYEALFDVGLYRLGECFTYLKNNEYDPNDPYNLHQYSFTQLHLLGDPQLPVWTDDPQLLNVAHEGMLLVNEATTFPVHVESGGNPIDGVTVCLWKDGDVYQIEQTSSGTAEFTFTPGTTGILHVTASGHNFVPYEGWAAVIEDFDIPTITAWGAVLMTLLLLTAGTIACAHRRSGCIHHQSR